MKIAIGADHGGYSHKEAIKVLRQALQINPKNTNTISLLANTYSRMKE